MVSRYSYRVGPYSLARSAGVRYAASLAVLTCLSLGLIHVVIGLLIEQLPELSGNDGLSRVEKWALVNSTQPARAVTTVRGWSGEAESRQPIPADVILETQGALVTAGESADGELQSTAVASRSLSDSPTAGTYRTVCVRLCDGAYFPISFATEPDRFVRDEAACQRGCSAESRLFVYRNPGESPRSMVDLDGRRYSDLSVAFQFKAGYDSSCTCRANPWEQEAQARHERFASRAHLSEHHAFVTPVASIRRTATSAEQRRESAVERGEVLAVVSEEWDVPLAEELAPELAEAIAVAPPEEASALKPLVAARQGSKPKTAVRSYVRRENRRGLRVLASVQSPGELVRYSLLGGF